MSIEFPRPPKLLLSSSLFQPHFFFNFPSHYLFSHMQISIQNNKKKKSRNRFFYILIIIEKYTIFLFWKVVANSDGSMHRHGILGGHGRGSVTFVPVFLQASSIVLGPGLGPGVSKEGKKAS